MKTMLINSCIVATAYILTSCSPQKEENRVITVKNSLSVERSFETVEILKTDLKLTPEEKFENILVRDLLSKDTLVSQFVDQDLDGDADVLLFQPTINAHSAKEYELVLSEKTQKAAEAICYSRFVPERTDDYTWENNKVAFRTFGPTAQKMIESEAPGGTLASGIDAWLKKVEYPIINKWYAKNDIRPGAYHEPSDEGMDNFHVGSSRGVGGSAVKKGDSYYISKNFTEWKTITNGPIRTSFVLTYADWDADGNKISEIKHISLDLGSNLTKYVIDVTGTNTLSVGLTLHENDGETTEKPKEGWISYWQPHADSELGTAVVVPNDKMIASELYITEQADRSNLYAQLNVENSKVVYYAGFAWKEANQYPTKLAWEGYLKDFSLKVNNPLEVVLP